MNEEEKISQINRSRTAHVALNWLHPIFEDIRTEVLAQLKNAVLSGDHAESKLVGHVSQLIALDHITDKLKTHVRMGETFAKELERHGE